VDPYRSQLGPSPDFDKSGYIFVFPDVRGRYMSEGKFIEMRPHIDAKKSKQDVDDASDLYDTIDWLLKSVPHNNGSAGIWGIFHPGFFTSASIIDSHPALKAASPQAPMTDLFMGDDAYHGGAFMLAANFGFYSSFKPQENPQLPPKILVPFDYGTKDGYEFFLNAGPIASLTKLLQGRSELWDDQIRHDTYDDYWKVRNLAPHMKDIHCAVLTVGGWFDAEDLQGPFTTFSLHRPQQSRHLQRPGRWPVGPRRLGTIRGRSHGPRRVCFEYGRLLPEQHSLPVFRTAPQGSA
jgi:putative CocE/NonD family hydrolase